jgi:hypothetical protein
VKLREHWLEENDVDAVKGSENQRQDDLSGTA